MKNKYIAAVLALLGGWMWLHKFYLWKWGQWLLYIIFAITFIPLIIWFVEWIMYLVNSKKWFDLHFNFEYMERERIMNEREKEWTEAIMKNV